MEIMEDPMMAMRVERTGGIRPESAAGPRNVYNLWDVDELFRWPLVVLGVTPGERRRLARKGLSAGNGMPSQLLCERFLRAVATVNALSCRISRLLRRKFERQAGPMRQWPEEQFMAEWNEAVRRGEYGALLWAAATRPLSAQALLIVSRGLARMLCEMAGHGAAEGVQFCAERQRMRVDIDMLRTAVSELEAENRELRDVMAALTGHGEARQGFLPSLPRQPERRDEGRMMRPLLGAGSGSCCDRDCNETCPSFDVCSKRVLIVGGVERMETLYRQVIEGGGGELDYHSGSLQGGTRQLEKSLRRADIILCPVNCNSHGACIKVKNLAKKHNKTCYMLPNGSMSTLSRLLSGKAL